MIKLLRVAWQNSYGEPSKVHLAQNVDKTICNQFINPNFHIVPYWYGSLCKMCWAMCDNDLYITPLGQIEVRRIHAVHPSELEKAREPKTD